MNYFVSENCVTKSMPSCKLICESFLWPPSTSQVSKGVFPYCTCVYHSFQPKFIEVRIRMPFANKKRVKRLFQNNCGQPIHQFPFFNNLQSLSMGTCHKVTHITTRIAPHELRYYIFSHPDGKNCTMIMITINGK